MNFRTQVHSSARHALFGCLLLVAACESETAGNTFWSMSFACTAQAAQSESVQVAIAPGTCASPAVPVYRAKILRGEVNGTAAPPSLKAGTYAFSATAYDGSGEAVTAICRDVALPQKEGVTLVLPGPQGCELPDAPGETDAGEPLDAHPLDAGSDGADAARAPADGGAPTIDASTPPEPDASTPPEPDASTPPEPDASTPPEPDGGADGGPCGAAPCQTIVYSSPTPDISLPKPCWAPGEFMPVTIHIPVTAKDWLWVKNHPDYGGKDREFWDYTGITTAGAVYRGGERQPLGLHAPTTPGSFSITWHPNDGGDKEVQSTLGFTVSDACP